MPAKFSIRAKPGCRSYFNCLRAKTADLNLSLLCGSDEVDAALIRLVRLCGCGSAFCGSAVCGLRLCGSARACISRAAFVRAAATSAG